MGGSGDMVYGRLAVVLFVAGVLFLLMGLFRFHVL